MKAYCTQNSPIEMAHPTMGKMRSGFRPNLLDILQNLQLYKCWKTLLLPDQTYLLSCWYNTRSISNNNLCFSLT